MPETLGTLNLKIVRLEHRLKLLEQQQRLSKAYPSHRANLARENWKVRSQLHQLLQHRQELLWRISNSMSERLFDGNGKGEQSFCSTN